MMLRLLREVSIRSAFSSSALLSNSSYSTFLPKQSSVTSYLQAEAKQLHLPAIPCDFLKWGSIGSFRTSRFAAGFTPLQRKPLDSIIDFERCKDRSPEDLSDIWDDVSVPINIYIQFSVKQCLHCNILLDIYIWLSAHYARKWKFNCLIKMYR